MEAGLRGLPHPHVGSPASFERERQVDAVFALLDSSDEPIPRETLRRLLDSFSPFAHGEVIQNPSPATADSGRALAVLSEILRASSEAGEPLDRWHSVLSALRRVLASSHSSEEQARRLEDLFQQSRVLLGELARRAQAYEVLQAEEQSRRLAHISERLSTTVEMAELLDILAETLPELGVPACHIALYTDPQRPAEEARMMMAYGSQGRVPIEAGGRDFPAKELVPRELLPTGRCYSLAVEPLHFREDQIGFAVVEAKPHQEEMYELLRGEVSAALKRLELLHRNVELYRDAVRARVFAEEGRRLAEEANLLKSRFLATVSHELRTPLSLIVGASDMILREHAREEIGAPLVGAQGLPSQLLQDVESIHASAEHLARLISDVLDLASSQAGELRLVTEQLRLTELLANAAVLGERMTREKGLAWRTEVPALLPVVMGDRTRLQQVILNLVSNAVKFTEQGTVTLWAEAGKDEVLVAVSDTGMGIPSAEQEVIFDEFRRSERTARRGYGGMGLGLAISRRLVELHRGRDRGYFVGNGWRGFNFLLHPPHPRVAGRTGRAAGQPARRRVAPDGTAGAS